MRYVDIYSKKSGAVEPVALDCIQVGDVVLNRSPIVKDYTMADGSLCVYPATYDTANFTLNVECNAESAGKIARFAKYCEIIIAGMSYGINRRTTPSKTVQYLPVQTGVVGYIMGQVQISEISSIADLYSVQIPLQLQVSDIDNTATQISVPAVKLSDFMLDTTADTLTDAYYAYKNGVFIRRNAYVTSSDSFSLSFVPSIPDGSDLNVNLYKGTYDSISTTIEIGAAASGAEFVFTDIPLTGDETEYYNFYLRVYSSDCKPFDLQFSVFKTG